MLILEIVAVIIFLYFFFVVKLLNLQSQILCQLMKQWVTDWQVSTINDRTKKSVFISYIHHTRNYQDYLVKTLAQGILHYVTYYKHTSRHYWSMFTSLIFEIEMNTVTFCHQAISFASNNVSGGEESSDVPTR